MLANSPLIYLFVYVRDLGAARKFYEEKLGFAVIEEDEDSVKYYAGNIILGLNKANQYGVKLETAKDETSLIVFHVDNIDEMNEALEKKGIALDPTLRYEIGATTAFYDPDGHCFTIYEPSEEAMTWDSAERIRTILNSGPPGLNKPPTLGKEKMIYLFLFVRDVKEAYDFYANRLGLKIIEEDEEAGVVKYDCGSIILSTHLIGGDANCAVEMDTRHSKSIAPVFLVDDIKEVYDGLAQKGIKFSGGIGKSVIGSVAKFEDPNGHMFYLYQISEEARKWPSGARIETVRDNLVAENN